MYSLQVPFKVNICDGAESLPLAWPLPPSLTSPVADGTRSAIRIPCMRPSLVVASAEVYYQLASACSD